MVLFDIMFSKKLESTNLNEGEFEVWSDIYKGDIKADLAIYGSSRAWVHFNPEILKNRTGLNTYNFGVDGQNFDIQYLRHQEYFENNLKPKLIVFSLDVFTFEKKNKLYNSDQFLPYMFQNSRYFNTLIETENFNLYDFILPSVRYFGKYEILYKVSESNAYPKFRQKGFRGNKSSWVENQHRALENDSKYTVKIDGNLISKFIKSIKELKKQGIKLIFVYTPEYVKGQDFVQNREKIFDIYRSLSEEEKIPFWDYSMDSISFEKQLFYNSEHLNDFGATIFSKKFSKDLLTHLKNKV
jgi:hypothetical protein